MITLVLDRSTDTQSVALVLADGHVQTRVFADMDSRSGDWPVRIRDFLAENGLTVDAVARFVVGQGPGSFAGIRAAIAFVQGAALPFGHAVTGLPSTLALTREGQLTAVVGDARRDRFWVVLYEGTRVVKDFFLVAREALLMAVPENYDVVTSDGARIDSLLASIYGARYRGALAPLAGRLAEVALAHPECLVLEPLPIYLQAAVRTAS